MQTDHLTSHRRPELALIRTKRTCHQVDFSILEDQSVKMKESEKIDKQLNLTRELKNGGTCVRIGIPIVVGVH